MEREVRVTEERWMEKARKVMQERDLLQQKLEHMDEQMENVRMEINRYPLITDTSDYRREITWRQRSVAKTLISLNLFNPNALSCFDGTIVIY